YSTGYSDGSTTGFNSGYDSGYDSGYSDGHYDGQYGLSITAEKPGQKINPSVKLVSMVYNDMFDFKRVRSLKQSGIKLRGYALEEGSISSKDLELRGAIEESFVVGQMARQLVERFGLSEDRSQKVAKMATHWRKLQARELTRGDADAFSEELLGVNMDQVRKAFQQQNDGNFADMKNLIKKAAEVNKTTPEHMAKIMGQLFL
ncbi:MAG: hypothetical protein AABY86_12750, partial [Bdellovibrionota bacterium]